MSLLNILRDGVKTINVVTKSLHSTVMYERYLSDDGYGSKVYASPVAMLAVVDYRAQQARTPEGVLTVSRAIITLVDIAAVNTATDGNGIGNNDKFTLPDGDTGPTLDISGFLDPGTKQPVAFEILLG